MPPRVAPEPPTTKDLLLAEFRSASTSGANMGTDVGDKLLVAVQDVRRHAGSFPASDSGYGSSGQPATADGPAYVNEPAAAVHKPATVDVGCQTDITGDMLPHCEPADVRQQADNDRRILFGNFSNEGWWHRAASSEDGKNLPNGENDNGEDDNIELPNSYDYLMDGCHVSPGDSDVGMDG